MQIEIAPTDIAKLTRHAQAAGFRDVQSYLTDFVSALADRPDVTELLTPLSDDELAESLTMLDQGMQQFESGGGTDVEQSRQQAHAKLKALD